MTTDNSLDINLIDMDALDTLKRRLMGDGNTKDKMEYRIEDGRLWIDFDFVGYLAKFSTTVILHELKDLDTLYEDLMADIHDISTGEWEDWLDEEEDERLSND